MESKKVSIVIPCLNEELTIERAVQEALTSSPLEVIVSDNGSKDRSIEIAQKAGARVVHCPKKGYGAALDFGIKNALGDIVVFGDADLSYPFNEVPRLITPILEDKADIVLGNRLHKNIEKGAMPFLNRHLGTPVLSFFIRLFFDLPITDCNSGMRALRKERYKELKLISPGMEYASEMIIRASECGFKYSEVPISFRKDKRGRAPHLRRWRDGWRHLRYILGCAPNTISITLPFLVGFISIMSALFFSYWQDPHLEKGVRHFHSAFVLLAFGSMTWTFLLSSITVKVLRDLNNIQPSSFVKKLMFYSDEAYLFYLNILLWATALLQLIILIDEWKDSAYHGIFDIEAVIRITAYVFIGTFIYAVDSVVSLLSMNVSNNK